MSEFMPEAAAIVSTIAEYAANAVRQAYVLGAQQGGHAAANADGRQTLEEWRREMLARYSTPSWKRSLVKLVPASRFRATDIHTVRRSELKLLQPENKSLSIGTHNALGALRKDGVIVKLGDLYAPAVDGVPLSADAGDCSQTYRPRNAYSEDFARLLGFTIVSWAMLEWAMEDLDEALTLSPSTFRGASPYSVRAARFAATVKRVAPDVGPCTLRHLQALAKEMQRLARYRTSLATARPCLLDGENALQCDGASGAAHTGGITWDSRVLIDICRAFDDASATCKELSYRVRLAHRPEFTNRLDSLHLRRLQNVPLAEAGALASAAIVEGMLPLIALSRVVAVSDPGSYARALDEIGVLDDEDVEAILTLAHEIDQASIDRDRSALRNARPLIEEVWNLGRSPAMVRRALAHRARRAGKVPLDIEVPLPGERPAYTPLLSVDGSRIAIATQLPDRWTDDEIIVDLSGINQVARKGAFVCFSGTRVIGNEAAMRRAPWLVDEPARL